MSEMMLTKLQLAAALYLYMSLFDPHQRAGAQGVFSPVPTSVRRTWAIVGSIGEARRRRARRRSIVPPRLLPHRGEEGSGMDLEYFDQFVTRIDTSPRRMVSVTGSPVGS